MSADRHSATARTPDIPSSHGYGHGEGGTSLPAWPGGTSSLVAPCGCRCGAGDEAADELGRVAEEVRITRKTLLELPDPQPPAQPAPKLPDRPA
ncbi:hypothetical protein CA983_13295 [Streptomyces swartbergensis]|uniref:Uncharacterized protein n=1 Tax=Streptomyces swartbergensis TaxID=487165 RepID=A0A243S555_9ACTN|nr:hypothetical protein CA983_13295 [Streptomyces swartbergensis]